MKRGPPINPDYGEDDWRSSYPPWWHAIIRRNMKQLECLLNDGLDPSRVQEITPSNNHEFSTTPLAYIVGSCNEEMLKLAAPYCSDINGICSYMNDGRAHTALQRASLCCTHWPMARILIDHGATLTEDLVEKAKEMDKEDMYYVDANTVDRVIYDFYLHVLRMKATAWCMQQIGGVWLDIIQLVVRDRMGNDEFATDLWAREVEDDSSSDSWRWSDDSSSGNDSEEEEKNGEASPLKRQKV